MQKTIAIVAGGDSGEFEVSIQSGATVKEHLDKQQYEAYLIVFENNTGSYLDDKGNKYIVKHDDFSLEIEGQKIIFDAVFNAIHGTPGEDGKLQGYFDMIGMPYTGCDKDTSVLTFNKHLCKNIVAELGFDIAPSVIFTEGPDIDLKTVSNVCGFPCFVKPNNGGSSVGISKVTEESMLPEAVRKAFLEDDQVLVERFISGREITCGVFQLEGAPRSLGVTEVITENEFFDYEAKYTVGGALEVTPAEIPKDIEDQCCTISEYLYVKLNCKGFVRFDYIYNDQGMYFLEVNTIPGLSPTSILPQQAEVYGISLGEMFSLAIEQALNH